ncbi:MAG: SdrD B-like domain-containing protein [Gammaproteobacteria bacterium]
MKKLARYLLFFGFLYSSPLLAGTWINVETIKLDNFGVSIDTVFDWLDEQGQANANKPNPWSGIKLTLTWNELWRPGSPANVYDFSRIQSIMDKAIAGNRNYKVLLSISDKYWVFQDTDGTWPTDRGGAISPSLKSTVNDCNPALPGCAYFDAGIGGFQFRTYSTNGKEIGDNGETLYVKKYMAKRWLKTVQNEWFRLWTQIAHSSIATHPALYGIVTPESSIAGIRNTEIDKLKQVGYPVKPDGTSDGAQYALQLIRQARRLKELLSNTPVIILNNINWIPPNRKPGGGYHIDTVVDTLIQDESAAPVKDKVFGLFAQDIANNLSYTRMVYPQLAKLAKNDHLKFGMITGESFRNFSRPKEQLLDLASQLLAQNPDAKVGHLLFNEGHDMRQDNYRPLINAINLAVPGQYSFLSPVPEPITGGGVGVMGDTVWLDENGNGIQDSNESGLANVTIDLQTCDGTYLSSTTSNSEGFYQFDKLISGRYRMKIHLPSGYQFSPEKATDQFKLDSNANVITGLTGCYDMTQGWKRLAIDVGMVPHSSGGQADALTLVKAIYFSANKKLWIRAQSDRPAGTAGITASMIVNGSEHSVGTIGWKANKGFYQQVFFNIANTPTAITLTSDQGGTITGTVEVR